MQFNSLIILTLLSIIELAHCAPTDLVNADAGKEEGPPDLHEQELSLSDKRKVDYYEYRHVVAEGVQKALDECREKFKWDRWNCPKKAFLDILDRNPLPSNKELGLTHALIASGMVLSLTRSCSFGTKGVCGCSHNNPIASRHIPEPVENVSGGQAALGSSVRELNHRHPSDRAAHRYSEHGQLEQEENEHAVDLTSKSTKFVWRGCDEIVKFAFKVSKIYLDSQDQL